MTPSHGAYGAYGAYGAPDAPVHHAYGPTQHPDPVVVNRHDMSGQDPIDTVLVLTQETRAALGALLYDLDAALAAPGVTVGPNQRTALVALRRSVCG